MKKATAKTIALILVMGFLMACLSGCETYLYKGEVKINADGSGTMTVRFGLTKEVMEYLIESDGGISRDDLEAYMHAAKAFSYDGVTYYGATVTENFSNIEELNALLNQDSDYLAGDMTGDVFQSLIMASDNSFIVAQTGVNDITMTITLLHEEQAESEFSDAEIEQIKNSMVLLMTFEFPRDIKQTKGSSNGIRISGNQLNIDWMALDDRLILYDRTETVVYEFTTADLDNRDNIIGFNDIQQGTWYYDAVMEMAKLNLVNGVGGGRFGVDTPMTRSAFLTILARYLYPAELQAMGEGDTWYSNAVAIAREKGLIGKNDFLDNINADCSREEMSYILVNALNLIGEDLGETVSDGYIPDLNSANSNYQSSIKVAMTKGLINGVDNNHSFNPKTVMTRGAASTVLYRLINESVRTPVKLS